jgi:AraC family transcriptional regulator
MRQELDPDTIVQTSDFTGFDGFRVLIRELPKNGGFGSGRKGVPYFTFGYRPGEELGRTLLRFQENPELETRMTRLSAIIPAEMPFEITHSDANGRIVSFEVHPRFLADVIKRAGIFPGKLQRVPPPGFVINQRVDYLCFLLMQQTENGAKLGKLYFESLATALVIAIVSQTDSRLLPEAGNIFVQNERMRQAIAYIESNLRPKLTLPEIAAASGLSVSHFSRLFSRVVGLTPHEYILTCRLRLAQKLLCLRGRECSIAEIAAESGFADQAHFSRYFHRVFGKAPLAYRRQQK